MYRLRVREWQGASSASPARPLPHQSFTFTTHSDYVSRPDAGFGGVCANTPRVLRAAHKPPYVAVGHRRRSLIHRHCSPTEGHRQLLPASLGAPSRRRVVGSAVPPPTPRSSTPRVAPSTTAVRRTHSFMSHRSNWTLYEFCAAALEPRRHSPSTRDAAVTRLSRDQTQRTTTHCRVTGFRSRRLLIVDQNSNRMPCPPRRKRLRILEICLTQGAPVEA